MIRDLSGAGRQVATADVLVIGAGTIGLVLATELSALGKRVVCLESGGLTQEGDTHPLNATEQLGMPYAGAQGGRARCLGGTSTRWGGALIPFQEADMVNADWPITWAELAPFVPKVEALFGLPEGPYEDPKIALGADFIGRLAKWPSFAKRNVYSLVRERADAVDGPTIWINATATRFTVESGQLTSVVAQAPDGSQISVSTAQTVLAAGAIESTRLLLLLAKQNPGAFTGQHLGEGFHDHLSAVVAELDVVDRRALNQIVGFRFLRGGGMRNLRFELAPASDLRSKLAPCFAHIGFSETGGGFSALRDVYRSLQRRQVPQLSVALQLLAGLPWLLRAAWWRFVHRRLLFPSQARIELHIVIEQAVRASNRIALSTARFDEFDQPLATINWEVGALDTQTMSLAIQALAVAWASSPFGRIADLRFKSADQVSSAMASGGGIYHPGGTTRTAREPEAGCVDSTLRVFGVPNLVVCATSVLPSGGGANPTMMLMLMAMRYVHEASLDTKIND